MMKEPKTPPWGLIMAYLDDQLPPRKRAAVERLIARHPEWDAQIDELRRVSDAAARLRVKPPDPMIWDNYWEEIDARIPRRIGTGLLLAGSAILVVSGVVMALAYAQHPILQVGIGLIVMGVSVLFVMVLHGRLKELPRDRYRKIRK